MFGFLAQLLAWCYDLVPNFGVTIVLFTVILMAAVTPFTIKSMRSAAEMSRLQPEIKKLQDQYKNDKVKQNEEMQALFKEHGVNPLGGCLPTLLPLPIFFIVFRLLERLTSRHNGAFAPLVRVLRHQTTGTGYVSPHYLSYKSSLTQHIITGDGHLKSFGMDLAATARQHHKTVLEAIPFYALIVIMTAFQYLQQRQMNQRNPQAANANPQMKTTMQIFPAFYAIISLNLPASVVVYLLVSGVFRMAQQSLSYRFDPVLARAATAPATIDATSRPTAAKGAKALPAPAGPKAKGGLFAGLREAANQAKAQAQEQPAGNGRPGRPGKNAPANGTPAARAPKPDRSDRNGGAKPGAPGKTEGGGASGSSPLSVRPSGRVTPPGPGGKRPKKGR